MFQQYQSACSLTVDCKSLLCYVQLPVTGWLHKILTGVKLQCVLIAMLINITALYLLIKCVTV
jgi:hypothetical protein